MVLKDSPIQSKLSKNDAFIIDMIANNSVWLDPAGVGEKE
jgi:hypothetical protein